MSNGRTLLSILDSGSQYPVHDPLWGHIYLPESMLHIIRSGAFVKLAAIKQLGPSYLVYPGASHTRYNHSLGVYFLAYKFIKSILRRSDDAVEFSEMGARSFLCAALCHDLGHFPFTHSLKDLPLLDHEVLTARIVEDELSVEIERAGAHPAMVASIIDKSRPSHDPEVLWFRQFLSGVLDPDKLDYLSRDAYFCGLPYGAQDIDFILRNIRFSPKHGLGLDEHGIRSIEHLLFSKYLLYQAVYWHPHIRIATGMIKKAVFWALNSELIQADGLYGLDDAGFQASFANIETGPGALVGRVFASRLHELAAQFAVTGLDELELNLMDLHRRSHIEDSILKNLGKICGTEFSAEDLLIDIPERVGFEVHIPVWCSDGIRDYTETGTVFNPPVVQNFTKSLRFARLALSKDLHDAWQRDSSYAQRHELFLAWCKP